MNRSLFVLFVVTTLSLSSAARARTWTDTQGNTINAKFVRVHEGNVIFSRSGRVVKVPFSNLTPEDQDHIRRQLEAKGKGRQLPIVSRRRTADNDSPAPLGDGDALSHDLPGESMPGAGAIRTWTDVRGRTMQAQFVGVEGEDVVLLRNGRRVTYPLAGFSPADQNFIRMQRQAGGRGFGSMPGPAGFDPHSAPGGFPGQIGEGYEGYEDPSADMGMEDMGMEDMGMEDMGMEGMEMSDPADVGEGMGMSDPAYAGEGMGMSDPAHAGEGMDEQGAAGFPDPAGASSGGYPGSPSPGGGMPIPQEVQIKYCTKCEGELSLDTKIGDNCPHCGIKFVAEETADGRTVDKHGREVSGTGSNIVTFTGIGAVVGAIIGILLKALRSGE